MSQQSWVLGIDLGGTKIELGLVSEEGIIGHKLRLRTCKEGGASAIKEQLIQAIQELNQQENILGIGVGVAGQIQAGTGEVYFAPNLDWHHVPLKADLEAATGIPVVVTNDVRAITWGEWLYGAGRNCNDFVCLFIGTGIGSGIVSGGHLLEGCSNTAGEIGHMTINMYGPICTCGNQGCFEAYAGGWGIAARALEAVSKNKEEGAYLMRQADGQLEAITARLVIEAADAQDPLAKQILAEAKQALIVGCINVVNALNPCRLILGGGILEGIPHWILDIEAGIQQRALKAATRSLQVVRALLIRDAGVIGSAALIRKNLTQAG